MIYAIIYERFAFLHWFGGFVFASEESNQPVDGGKKVAFFYE